MNSKEGNIHPVSLVQEIFNEKLIPLQMTYCLFTNCFMSRPVGTRFGRDQSQKTKNYRESLKLVSNMALKKWTIWNIPTAKTGLPLRKFHYSQKLSTRGKVPRKVVFYFPSNRFSRNLLVNVTPPMTHPHSRPQCHSAL